MKHSATFFDLATGPQAMEGQGRLFAGRDNQVQLGREMVEEKGERAMDRGRGDHLVVVQD